MFSLDGGHEDVVGSEFEYITRKTKNISIQLDNFIFTDLIFFMLLGRKKQNDQCLFF